MSCKLALTKAALSDDDKQVLGGALSIYQNWGLLGGLSAVGVGCAMGYRGRDILARIGIASRPLRMTFWSFGLMTITGPVSQLLHFGNGS
jgi:hypothetical protein